MVDLRLGWVTVLELLRQVVSVVGIVTLVLAGASLVPFLALPIPAIAGGGGADRYGWYGATVPLRPRFELGASGAC